ncbi:MAG TPA: hypothetical protein VGH98_12675 [Gemmatimonadaceae bacterium]
MFFTIDNYATGEHRPDAGERIELLRRRKVDVDPARSQRHADFAVRQMPFDAGVAAGQSVRWEPMAAARLGGVCLGVALLDSPSRVDGDELSLEGTGVVRWQLLDAPDSA